MRRAARACALLLGGVASFAVEPRASATCGEVSDVVGYRRCVEFGRSWAVSSANFEFDVGYVHAAHALGGPTSRWLSAAAGPFNARRVAYDGDGFALRGGLSLGAHVYVPVAFTATFGTIRFFGASPDHDGQSVALVTGLGVGVPLGSVRLRTELDVGVRSIEFGGRCNKDCLSAVSIEPVVGVDWPITSYQSIGVYVGGEPIGSMRFEIGVRIGTGTRPVLVR